MGKLDQTLKPKTLNHLEMIALLWLLFFFGGGGGAFRVLGLQGLGLSLNNLGAFIIRKGLWGSILL